MVLVDAVHELVAKLSDHISAVAMWLSHANGRTRVSILAMRKLGILLL